MLVLLAACSGQDRPRPGPEPTMPACTPATFFADADGDGAGDATRPWLSCEAPPGHVPEAGDCDEADPAVHPGATEACDGVDQDCDGEIDEGLLALRFPDLDGDGFGDPEAGGLACEGIEVPYDCDDGDPALHPAGDVRFVDVTDAAGLSSYVQWDPIGEPDRCSHEQMGGGGAVGDVDGDGLPDLFLARMYAPDPLLRNRGDGTFAEVQLFDEPGATNGATFFDADGDGDLDLFVSRMGPEGHLLYVNEGGALVEDGLARGVRLASADGFTCSLVFSAAAADVDRDGDLDLHLSAWQEEHLPGNDAGRLLVNDGTGHFTDGTTLDLSDRAVFTTTFVDLDGDLDEDLLVAADWGRPALYEAVGGWVDVTASAGVGDVENAMGQAIGDPDGDGDPDVLVTSIYDEACPGLWGCSGNRLWRNEGGLVFSDATDEAGVRDGQWGWGVAFVDWDLDGDEDVVQAAGFDFYTFRRKPGRAWRNRGDGTFEDGACATGLVDVGDSRAVIPFDLEGDGDPDVLLTQSEAPPRLWRNDQRTGRRWVAVTAEVGAVVRIEAGGRHQVRWITASPTYLGNGPAEARFGLGDAEVVDRIEVTWPDGGVSEWTAVPADGIVRATR